MPRKVVPLHTLERSVSQLKSKLEEAGVIIDNICQSADQPKDYASLQQQLERLQQLYGEALFCLSAYAPTAKAKKSVELPPFLQGGNS